MGVWIETWQIYDRGMFLVSHPVWVCGLKLFPILTLIIMDVSHPVWVCGLKQLEREQQIAKRKSHPVWVCGLKR